MNTKCLSKKIIFTIPALAVVVIAFFLVRHFAFNTIKANHYNEQTKQYSCYFRRQNRHYVLFLPQDFESKTQEQKSHVKLILMLHGAGESAALFNNKIYSKKI